MSNLQIDHRRPRESINQVKSFIESAIYYGALFEEQSLRTIHGILPDICKLAFGTECPRMSRFDFDKGHPVLEFLSSAGLLFNFLLAHFSNRQWVYTILDEHLSLSTSEALKSRELLDLPDMFQGRVVDANTLSPTHSHSNLSPSLTSSSNPSLFNSSLFIASLPYNAHDRFTITFNMLEYYLFYFAYTLTHPPFPFPASRRDWYLVLLRRYLHFFVPPLIPSPVSLQTSPSTLAKQPSSSSFSEEIHLLNTKRLPPGTILTPLDRLAGSKFFIGCLIENWLSAPSKKDNTALMPGALSIINMDNLYAPLPMEALQAISILTEHISVCDLLYVLDTPVASQEFRLSSYSNNLSSEKLVQIVMQYAYRLLLPKLLPFFKLATKHHPMDSSFLYLIQAWIFWLTPHFRCSHPSLAPKVPRGLAIFVHDNVSLYIDVFFSFLEKASYLDFHDAKSTALLQQVIAMYQDPLIHESLAKEVRSIAVFKQGAMYVDFLGYVPPRAMEHLQTILQKFQSAQRLDLCRQLAQLFDLPFDPSAPSPALLPKQTPLVNVYDVDMTADQLLTPKGKYQLKHGLRKCPPLPRMYSGTRRELVFSTEIRWLVPWTYHWSDRIREKLGMAVPLRWMAEKNLVLWILLLLNLLYGLHLKLIVLSGICILFIYFLS